MSRIRPVADGPHPGYCDVTVFKAQEAPQGCGLELPCPIHDPSPVEPHPSFAAKGPFGPCQTPGCGAPANIVLSGERKVCDRHDPFRTPRQSLRERGYANVNEYTGIALGDRRDV